MAAKTAIVVTVLVALGLVAWTVLDRPSDSPSAEPPSESAADVVEEDGATLAGMHVADAGKPDVESTPSTPTKAAQDTTRATFITGVVRYADESREPVGGLELRILRIKAHPTEPRWSQATTAADGSFRSSAALSAGRVRIEVAGAGLSSISNPVVLAEFDQGSAEPDSLELLFPWSGRATVVVLDADEVPIAGAKVALFREDTWNTTQSGQGTATDGQGTVAIGHLPLDEALIAVVRASGYGPVRSKTFTAGTSAQDVRIVVHAERGALVRGHVERADGSRAADALVSVAYSALRERPRNVPPTFARTDASGRFEMVDVAAGRYQFRADLGGTVAATEGMLEIAAGETVEVILRPANQVSIAGVVVDGDGKAWTADRRSSDQSDVRGPAYVSVQPVEFRPGVVYPHRVMLDEKGRFEFRVPPGNAFRLDPKASHLFFATSDAVEVDAGATNVRLVWMQPRVRLLVRVLDAGSGAPLEGAEVIFAKSLGGRETTTREHCDKKGEALGPWVGAGTVRAFTFAKGHGHAHAAVEIGVTEEGDRQHVFRLGPGRSVRGRVEDREGKPLAGRRVGILVPGLPFCCFEDSLVVTDEQGAFRVEGFMPQGGQVAVFGGTGDTRWRADASGDDVVIVVKSPR